MDQVASVHPSVHPQAGLGLDVQLGEVMRQETLSRKAERRSGKGHGKAEAAVNHSPSPHGPPRVGAGTSRVGNGAGAAGNREEATG